MLAEWQSETKGRLATLQPALSMLEKACRTAPEPNGQARKLLAAARARVESVAGDGSLGAHNYAYVSTLLDQAEEELNRCRTLLATRPKPQETGQ